MQNNISLSKYSKRTSYQVILSEWNFIVVFVFNPILIGGRAHSGHTHIKSDILKYVFVAYM